MKVEARVVGFDDAPFVKGKDSATLVVGAVFRGGRFMDGVLSTRVQVDGSDATDRLVELLNRSHFKPQLQAVLLDGIAVGGFNVIDIHELSRRTGLPVITVIRVYPDFEKIESALIKIGMSRKIKLLRSAGRPEPVSGGPGHHSGQVFIQRAGCTHEKAAEFIRLTATHSFLPEPIRAAHLIAAGVTVGESKGGA